MKVKRYSVVFILDAESTVRSSAIREKLSGTIAEVERVR